ncbi:LuxR C-terminal-related transcriptional regulator [Streptomyces sp. NPDC096205]|uniref:LuxR C-terminal-related transcriptional regulator n=1 Tax=Streptomyces sp. NPDC096205 TaxID=3366081 RepID=UPI003814FE60
MQGRVPRGHLLRREGLMNAEMPHLEEKDRRILELLFQGFGDASVGRQLGISHRTVQRRVGRLMTLLGVTGRVALGARVQELGLLPTSHRQG